MSVSVSVSESECERVSVSMRMSMSMGTASCFTRLCKYQTWLSIPGSSQTSTGKEKHYITLTPGGVQHQAEQDGERSDGDQVQGQDQGQSEEGSSEQLEGIAVLPTGTFEAICLNFRIRATVFYSDPHIGMDWVLYNLWELIRWI